MAGDSYIETIPLSKTTKFIVDNRGRTAPTADHGIPLIATNCISNDQLYPSYEKLRFVSKETYANWFRSHPVPGDIILTNKGSQNGAICLVPNPVDFVIAQDMVALRANEKVIDPLFLFAALRSANVQREIKNLDVSGVIPHFKKTDFDKLHLPYPARNIQEAIGRIYFEFCAKIELNRRMNATLESMARALFQSWFVDFDPVRAKLDGRQPVGMDEATAALFPDSFQDSELGPIPKGWRVAVLDELIKFVIGGDWGVTGPTDDETISCYCIRGADIPSLQSGGVGKMPTRFLKRSSVEKRKLEDGDLAIEISGGSPTQSTGRPVLASDALLQSLGRPLVASNFCRIVKLKSSAYSKFVYLWLRRLYDAGELLQFENGTTGIKNFAFVIFSERYLLVVPDLRVSEAFDRAVSPFFARIQANSQEYRTIATLRDSLLPKLLSGELSVST